MKNYLSDLDKLGIFKKYGSNFIDRAYIEHYQTAGADVEATLKISHPKWSIVSKILDPGPHPP